MPAGHGPPLQGSPGIALRQKLKPYEQSSLSVDQLRDLINQGRHRFSQEKIAKFFKHLDKENRGRISLGAFIDFAFGAEADSLVEPAREENDVAPNQADDEADRGQVADRLEEPIKLDRADDEADRGQVAERWAEPIKLDRDITREFLGLDQHGKVQAEYVWIDEQYSDGKTFDLCSKAMTLDSQPSSVEELPLWAYSGDDDTDVQLVPRRIYMDPFRRGHNILILADSYHEAAEGSGKSYGGPRAFNKRPACEAVMARADEIGEDPWFGIEQEYYLLDVNTGWPLGWPKGGFPKNTDAYYCATGAVKAPGRDVVEAHYRACLHAGVKIGGINSEVQPGQWEYQIGPRSGLQCADDLWMSRYIMQRVCEMYHVGVTFDPKPVPNWAGISCHTNYSTASTRAKPGGLDAMKEQIERLRVRHRDFMKVSGEGNERRATGQHNAPSMDAFTWGVSSRDVTVRISAKCASMGCGYYEDRRPAANMDPYVVMKLITQTTLCLDAAGSTSSTADIAAGVGQA